MKDGAPSRRESVTALIERPSTRVLIIGAGINGIGLFRELTSRGIDSVLVDSGDFASGATAASSHMIHGGIRYLENGEFRLVRESVRERNELLRLAPHRVVPLETTIPIFSTFSGILAAPMRLLRHRGGRPVERGAALIKVGLMLYDLFSRDGGRVPRHRFRGRSASLAVLPQLDPRVRWTATYYDASVADPERLAIDVLLDGLDAGAHARAANYVAAISAGPGGVALRDEESGAEFSVSAELVVNATGPWTDLTNDSLGAETRLMGGTKGSHVVLDHPALSAAVGGREVFFENSDGRIVLIHPLKGRVLVGTTELDADPSQPAICTEEEVRYFFDLVRQVFPRIEVSETNIVYRFAGIRPLPNHGDVRAGFASRDYRIVETPLGSGALAALSLVGGKLTTFRALGRRLAEEVERRIGEPPMSAQARLPIGGGGGFPRDEHRQEWLARQLPGRAAERQEQLLSRYGTRAIDVAQHEFTFGETSVIDGFLTRGELHYLVSRERVVRMQDVILRRTDLAFRGVVSMDGLERVASALAGFLGWDDDRVRDEIAATATLLRTEHGVAV